MILRTAEIVDEHYGGSFVRGGDFRLVFCHDLSSDMRLRRLSSRLLSFSGGVVGVDSIWFGCAVRFGSNFCVRFWDRVMDGGRSMDGCQLIL